MGEIIDRIVHFFHSVWRKRQERLLFYLSGVLFITAAATGPLLLYQGHRAEENASSLLAAYEQTATPIPARQATPSPIPSPSEPIPTPVPTQLPYEGYAVIGVLLIDKMGVELPVIAETSDQALEVSCCYYQGALPGDAGNLVIIGHNYASGAVFGKLKLLASGDTVVLSTSACEYIYSVYDTEVIAPDDVQALNDYQGDMALTLVTCTQQGSKRLLVRCRYEKQS